MPSKKYFTKEEEKAAKNARSKKYADSEKGTQKRREYQRKNKDKLRRQNNESKQKLTRATTLKRRWYGHRRNIEQIEIRRGVKLESNITFEVYSDLVQDKCFYCGFLQNQQNKVNGIDRVDNNKGYVLDNVVTACWPCNRCKGGMGVLEFTSVCLNVAVNLLRKAELEGTVFTIKLPNGQSICWDMK